MTYAIGRPAHLRATAIRSRAGRIHLADGWNAFRGTKTLCGKYLKWDGDYYHLARFTRDEIAETFDYGTPCAACLRRTRERERGNDR